MGQVNPNELGWPRWAGSIRRFYLVVSVDHADSCHIHLISRNHIHRLLYIFLAGHYTTQSLPYPMQSARVSCQFVLVRAILKQFSKQTPTRVGCVRAFYGSGARLVLVLTSTKSIRPSQLSDRQNFKTFHSDIHIHLTSFTIPIQVVCRIWSTWHPGRLGRSTSITKPKGHNR